MTGVLIPGSLPNRLAFSHRPVTGTAAGGSWDRLDQYAVLACPAGSSGSSGIRIHALHSAYEQFERHLRSFTNLLTSGPPLAVTKRVNEAVKN